MNQEKPKNVSLAVNLQWASLTVTLVNGLFGPTGIRGLIEPNGALHLSSPLLVFFVILFLALIFALLALLTFKISAGKNWARIVFLALCLGGIPQTFLQLPATLQLSMVAGISDIFQAILQVVVLFLIFTKPGSEWFNGNNRLDAFNEARLDRQRNKTETNIAPQPYTGGVIGELIEFPYKPRTWMLLIGVFVCILFLKRSLHKAMTNGLQGESIVYKIALVGACGIFGFYVLGAIFSLLSNGVLRMTDTELQVPQGFTQKIYIIPFNEISQVKLLRIRNGNYLLEIQHNKKITINTWWLPNNQAFDQVCAILAERTGLKII